jgi:hypothetical protein
MVEKGAVEQPILAIIAGTAGLVHGTPFYRNLWIAVGSILLGIIPFTIIFVVPTNETIINDNKSVKSGNESQINVTKKKDYLINGQLCTLFVLLLQLLVLVQ